MEPVFSQGDKYGGTGGVSDGSTIDDLSVTITSQSLLLKGILQVHKKKLSISANINTSNYSNVAPV